MHRAFWAVNYHRPGPRAPERVRKSNRATELRRSWRAKTARAVDRDAGRRWKFRRLLTPAASFSRIPRQIGSVFNERDGVDERARAANLPARRVATRPAVNPARTSLLGAS